MLRWLHYICTNCYIPHAATCQGCTLLCARKRVQSQLASTVLPPTTAHSPYTAPKMRAISEYSRLVEAPTTDTQAASASEGTCGQGGGRHGGGRLRSNKGHGSVRVWRQGRSFQALEVQAAPQRKSAQEQSAQQWLMHHRSLHTICLTCDIATSAAPKMRVSFHCELKQFSVPFMWQMCFAMLDSEMPAATWGDGGWVERLGVRE